jgi:hypothetical protein
MMPDLVVYRSEHPDVLAVIADFEAEHKAWDEKAHALLAELGFADRAWMVRHLSDGMRITGVAVRDGDRENPPAGWKVAEGDRPVLTPDKRRKAGKDAQARIDKCQPPTHPRVRLPGMPGVYFSEHRIHYPNLRDLGDGAIYVEWSTEVPELAADGDDKRRASGVDLGIWQRIKLSEFYAAVEAHEEAEEKGPADA